MPQSQDPQSASVLASMSVPSATTRGSAPASARTPSTARAATIGVASGAYSASAACAIALIPLVAETSGGRPTVSSGSYTTVRGSTRSSRPVRLRPASVRPHTGVISEPE